MHRHLWCVPAVMLPICTFPWPLLPPPPSICTQAHIARVDADIARYVEDMARLAEQNRVGAARLEESETLLRDRDALEDAVGVRRPKAGRCLIQPSRVASTRVASTRVASTRVASYPTIWWLCTP